MFSRHVGLKDAKEINYQQQHRITKIITITQHFTYIKKHN